MWDDPVLYALEYADDPEFDVAFWRGLADRRGARTVLELACGTGRVAFPLARGGLSVTGVDSTAPLVERARTRLTGEPAEVRERLRFAHGDMRGPELGGERFDLVVIPHHSLQYLHTLDDQLACLGAAREALTPGGALAFDVLVPRLDFLSEARSSVPGVRLDTDHPAPELGIRRVLRTYADRYDPVTQTLRSTNMYELHWDDGQVEHRVADLAWHMYFPRELELLLAVAGLDVLDRFGDYGFEPWDEASRRYLWVCAAR